MDETPASTRLDRRGVEAGVAIFLARRLKDRGALAVEPAGDFAALAVFLLTVQGFVIDRVAGIDYLMWRPRQSA